MDEQQERMSGLHNLSPTPGSTKARKRVGRGQGSGTGKTSGRGQKGQKSRSGSHMMRAGFIGGQMPLHMQVPKLRGAHSKDSMPVGPFRTFTHGVNVSSLAARFEAGAEVTPEALLAARVLRTLRHPVKILGDGEIDVALTVHAHRFSASARQKIEAAGGTVVLIDPSRSPRLRSRRGQARRVRGPGRGGREGAQEEEAAEATTRRGRGRSRRARRGQEAAAEARAAAAARSRRGRGRARESPSARRGPSPRATSRPPTRPPRATRPDARRAHEHLARARAAAPAGLHVR